MRAVVWAAVDGVGLCNTDRPKPGVDGAIAALTYKCNWPGSGAATPQEK